MALALPVRSTRGLCALGAAAILSLAAGAAQAQLTTWTYAGSALQYIANQDKAYFYVDYDTPPTVGALPVFDGIHIYGTGSSSTSGAPAGDIAFSIGAADYIPSPIVDPNLRGNRLLISGVGTIDGAAWQHPADYIRTQFDFGMDISGGTIDLFKIETGFELRDHDDNFVTGVGSGTSLGEYDGPGGYGLGFAFEDRFGSDITTAETIHWTVAIYYDWTGMSPGDVFTFHIPNNSIDIQVLTPEPATLVFATLGLVPAVWRRRR